jgi:hypothetical protein
VEKKQKNILVWTLTWAGLLLLVLYSPLGSPELFNQNSYYYPIRDGVYNNGETVNFPVARKNSGNGGGYQAISIPDYTPQSRTYSYSVSGYGKTTGPNATYATGVNNFSSNINRNSGNSGGMSGGESFSSSGNNSKNKNNMSQETGLLSLSTDLSLLANNAGNRQLAGTGLTDPTTDPGGDPTGDPIPVGDGSAFLIVLVSIYILLKFKIFRR